MKIIYDAAFADIRYSDDNAAIAGRMEAAMSGLNKGGWEILSPEPASGRYLRFAHDPAYIEKIAQSASLNAIARLSVGGAILAAKIAFAGESAFACIRPPGHHASRSNAWGYCVFNNVAIALLALRAESSLGSAFVIDIDQHTGDGTRNILGSWRGTEVFNPFAVNAAKYLRIIENRLEAIARTDIFAVSAGFDAYKRDVGGLLDTDDYERIGELVRAASLRLCGGRRFAVLEGGYYLPDLGANLYAFCRGFA